MHYRGDLDGINSFLDNTVFEHIFDTFPDVDALRGIFADYFNSSGRFLPNINHAAIASLLHGNFIRHVITPNYDRGIEVAYQTLFPGHTLRSIVTEMDFNASGGIASPSVFKIHGCVSQPDTLAFALRHEHFEDWKARCLQALIADSLVIFIGYSGIDIDICPQIYANRTRLTGTMWLHRFGKVDELSPSARLLTDKELFPDPQTVYRLGWDLTAFIQALTAHFGADYAGLEAQLRRKRTTAVLPPVTARELVDRIKAVLEHPNKTRLSLNIPLPREEGAAFWRLALANSLANPRLGDSMARAYEHFLNTQATAKERLLATPKFLRMRGHTKYHRGQYRPALADFDAAMTCIDEIEKTGTQTPLAIQMERLRIHMEAAAAYKDAMALTPDNMRIWKSRCVDAIVLAYRLCGVVVPENKERTFFEILSSFFQDIKASVFAEFYDWSDFGRIFSALVYHIYLVHEAIVGNTQEPVEAIEQDRRRDYAIIVRSLLNKTGNWRTAQYLEGRLVGGFGDGEVREFPPINDIVASAVLEYRKVDAAFDDPKGYFGQQAAKDYSQFLIRLNKIIDNAKEIGAIPPLWKAMYRRLRLQVWQEGYDIFKGKTSQHFEGLSDTTIDAISKAMAEIIGYLYQIDRDDAISDREMKSILVNCPRICITSGLLETTAHHLGIAGRDIPRLPPGAAVMPAF